MKAFKSSNLILVMTIILLGLLGGGLILNWQVYQSLQAELRQGDSQIVTADLGRFAEGLPTQDDLLKVIDECAQVFQDEEVVIRSYQLEGIATDENQAGLNYASIRFRLQGAWTGIERGLSKIERLTSQSIQVKEALLSPERGEILFKIYFFTEPNTL